MDREETAQWLLRSGEAGSYGVENLMEETAMENKREKLTWMTVFMFCNLETQELQCFILPGTYPKDKVFEIGLKTIHPLGLSALALNTAMKTLTTHEYHVDEITMDNPLSM